MTRKRGPVWEHFNIISKSDDSHPHVQCKYCFKNFKRAVPDRMQAHLNKKCKAKSQSMQQNTDTSSNHLSGEEQNPIENFALSTSFKLPNEEEVPVQTCHLEIYKTVEKNYADSLNGLGYCYQHGIGIKKDEIRAFDLYKEASEKGAIASIHNLGYCYQHGIGIKKDETRAFELYKEATEKGNIGSIFNLGRHYLHGMGTEKNEIKAFELFERGAKKGDIDSINGLGHCYHYGIGTEQNEFRAFELYFEAAGKGHIGSILSLNGIKTLCI